MSKLKILVAEPLKENSQRLTDYTKFLKDLKLNDAVVMYQDLNLKRPDHRKQNIQKPYKEITNLLAFPVEQSFAELVGSPSFDSFVQFYMSTFGWKIKSTSLRTATMKLKLLLNSVPNCWCWHQFFLIHFWSKQVALLQRGLLLFWAADQTNLFFRLTFLP